ncbi:exodeoxyribonuclease III [Persephonella sp.]
MKICTFNVNSIRARKELIIRWLTEKETDIDVLCFQEVKVEEKLFPYEDFESLGYHCTVYSQKGYNGVATLSRKKPSEIIKGIEDSYFDQQKRVLSVKIGDIWVVNTYAPHGDIRGTDKYYYKLDWYRKYKEFLSQHFTDSDSVVLLGDFNVALEDIDVWSPQLLADSIGTMPEEREALRNILQLGYADCFRKLYPEKKQFTWWDYIGGAVWRDEGMRIDYIFAGRQICEKVKDVYVDMWPRRRRTPKPSDHAPVIGIFEV